MAGGYRCGSGARDGEQGMTQQNRGLSRPEVPARPPRGPLFLRAEVTVPGLSRDSRWAFPILMLPRLTAGRKQSRIAEAAACRAPTGPCRCPVGGWESVVCDGQIMHGGRPSAIGR
jgi:hypothetical protein